MKKILFILFITLCFKSQNIFAQCYAYANFTYTINGNGVTVYDSSTTSSGGLNDSFSYVNFGGNVVYFRIGWNWHDASFLFPTHGTYPICLHIKDSLSNCTDSICKTITVYGCYTSIDTTSSDSIYTFKASSSGGTAPYTYSWTIFDSTSNTTLYSGSLDSLSVIILFGHNCYAYLTSTDSTGCTSYEYQEIYNYWVPQPSTCYNSISFVNNDSLYYFMAVPWGGTPPYTYNWLIMDSTTNTILYSGNTASANVIFPLGHLCNVQLSTTDSIGCVYTNNGISIVYNWQQNNLPCNAVFVLLPDSVNTHLYQGYNYSTGTNLHYSWSWGDGTSDTLPYPNHTYAAAGFYNVCLTVWNSNCLDSQCVYYNVNRMNAKNAMHSINIINTGTTGIKNINLEKSFSVYPNPSSSELTINLKDEKIEFIKIYTINSQLMMQSNTSNNKLNIGQLPSNIYFVEIKTAANIYRAKFVKE
jgi:hypothetical protein